MKLICRDRLEFVVELIGRSVVYGILRGFHNDRELLNKRIEVGVDDVARVNDTKGMDITGGEICERWSDGSVKAVRFHRPCTLMLPEGHWMLDEESMRAEQNESLRRLFYDYIASKEYSPYRVTAVADSPVRVGDLVEIVGQQQRKPAKRRAKAKQRRR